MKTLASLLVAFLGIVFVLPIWLYLLYKILAAVNATDLMWFLYWVYVPVAIATHGLSQAAKHIFED